MDTEYTSNIQNMIGQDKVKYINKQCEAIEQNAITNTIKNLDGGVNNLNE